MDTEPLDIDFGSEDGRIQIELLSTGKFIFLEIITFGIYGIWWMYKSWNFFKERNGTNVMPAARAIFSIIFFYPLLEEIRTFAQDEGYNRQFSSIGLFVLYVVLNLAGRMPDPYFLFSLLVFFVLIQPFKALNYAIYNSDDYEAIMHSGFNQRQIALIAVSTIFWVFLIVPILFPDLIVN